MRRTKIICTLGPSSNTEEMISKLVDCGMNVARLKFSHGTHETHQLSIDRVKAVREAKKTKKELARQVSDKAEQIVKEKDKENNFWKKFR